MTDGVRMGVSGSGYVTIHVDGHSVYAHRLAALVHYDVDDLRGADVHHVDGETFNNAPDHNLQPLASDGHRAAHLNGEQPGARS